VENLLRSLDPLLIGTIVLPLGLIGAASALRMACAICSVRVPDFVSAATVVVVNLVANFGLRMILNHNHLSLGLGSQLLLVLLTSDYLDFGAYYDRVSFGSNDHTGLPLWDDRPWTQRSRWPNNILIKSMLDNASSTSHRLPAVEN